MNNSVFVGEKMYTDYICLTTENKMLSTALGEKEKPAFHYFYAILDGSGVSAACKKMRYEFFR